jgi:septal ring factor EnvC (AmiA/AmiB activator)
VRCIRTTKSLLNFIIFFILNSESEDEGTSENIRQDIEVLENKRSELMKQREGLDTKLKEGCLLNVEEERRYSLFF